MKQFKDSCGFFLADYWRDFFRGWTYEGSFLILLFLTIFGNWKVFSAGTNLLAGVPLLFAMFSGTTHSVSMPYMMYLAPLSHGQREAYLQKMLYVKVAMPIFLALLWDLALFLVRPVSVYVFVLQMTGIFEFSLMYGITYNKGVVSVEARKEVYGGLAPYMWAIMLACILEGVALCVICTGNVSRMEFWIVFGVVLLLTAPLLTKVCRQWKEIRANFAEYEAVVGTEVER